jgi:hypothetical protein
MLVKHDLFGLFVPQLRPPTQPSADQPLHYFQSIATVFLLASHKVAHVGFNMAKSHYEYEIQKTISPNPKKSTLGLLVLRTIMLVLAAIYFFSTLRANVRAIEKCTTSDPIQEPGTVKNHSICVDGTTKRRYLLFLPSSYTTSTKQPLIISYHGGSRNASRQLSLDQFTSPKYNANTIVAYPQGIDVSSGP